jgi:hypothetical protein
MVMFYQDQPKTVYTIGKKVRKVAKPFVQLAPRKYHEVAVSTKSFPSRVSEYDKSKDPLFASVTRYEGEMADREKVARVEIERKKTMCAPLYNKGGYQYIGDVPPEIIKTLGRKM